MEAIQANQVALGLFVTFFVARYLRTIVSIFTWLTYKPKPIPEKPKYRPENATVVVPTTFKSPGDFIQCLRGVLACSPAAVIVVTSHANVELVKTWCTLNSFAPQVKVLGVEKLNKREQILRALQEVETDITVFADDDVFWLYHYIGYLLAIFENPKVGAGGTRQRVRRNKESINCWNFLGISYLERRAWNNVVTNAIDGSLSTLSGRSAAYRTEILKTDEFSQYFREDLWLGRKLNSDDDKCLTQYVYSHSWQIALQSDSRSLIETTLQDNPKYVSQCVRWARAHWRGNFTVMTNESYWRSLRYCWGTYVIYAGQSPTPVFLVGSLLFGLLLKTMSASTDHTILGSTMLGSWILFTKVLKLIPHFTRHPGDLKFIPLSIIFSYLHGFINIYALVTLHVTVWGSQILTSSRLVWRRRRRRYIC